MEAIFLDTNIIVDIIQKRKGFFDEALQILSLYKKGLILACSSLSIVNSAYICKNPEALKDLCSLLKVVDTTATNAINAFNLKFKDYEDAVQYLTCKDNARILITRNKKDFKKAKDITIFTPTEFLQKLETFKLI